MGNAADYWGGIFAMSLAAAVIVAAAATSAALLSAPLKARPVRYIGKISYGLYLWHWPALFAADALLSSWKTTAAYAAAFALAALSHQFIERPLRAFRTQVDGGKRVLGLLSVAALAVGLTFVLRGGF